MVTNYQAASYNGFTALEQSAVEASLMTKIKETRKSEIAKSISNDIAVGYSNLGHKIPTGQDLEILHNAVMKCIEVNFSTMSLKEVSNAIYLGTCGVFKNGNEVLTMAPEKIFGYIKSYREGIRKEAIAKKNSIESKQEEVKHNPKDIERIWIEDMIFLPFVESKEKGKSTFDDRFGLIFDFLVEKGILSASNELKVENYTIIRERIIKSNSKANLERSEWRMIDEFRCFEFDKKTMAEKKKNKFYNEAVRMTKERILNGFIDSLIFNNIDLIDEVNKKCINE